MIFVSAGFERRGSIAIADVMRTAHFRQIDPAAERICLYTSKSASESQSHLMLKMVQLERFQRAIDANFKHDDLLVIPEKTSRAEGLYRRRDLSLSRKVSIFSGAEIQLSFISPAKLHDRATDHGNLIARGRTAHAPIMMKSWSSPGTVSDYQLIRDTMIVLNP